MILFGGISEGKTMNDFWSFDFGKNTIHMLNEYTKIPNSATESWKQERGLHAVWGHSMVVFEDKLMIFGGADENGKATNNVVVLDASK
jgi:hypothetical protein